MLPTQKERLQRHLQQLVAMPSTSDNEPAITDCLTYIQQHAEQHGWLCQSVGQSLVVSSRIGKKFELMFQAHVDVVPGDSAQFRVIKQGSKFYGRGVYDMKFAVACYLELMASQAGNPDICFVFTSDEETSGQESAKIVAAGFKVEAVVLPDGGQDWRLEKSAKGGWAVELTAPGTPAHGSRPWEGKNPIETLARLLPKLIKLNQNKATKTTVTLSQIHAGEVNNQVPAVASLTLDCRFIDMAAYAKLRRRVESIAKKTQLQMETKFFVEPMQSNLNSPYHQAMQTAITTVTKLPAEPGVLSLGASDGRFYAAAGMPVILCRPPGGGAHSDSEWISQKGFFQFYQVLERFLTQQVE